MSKATAPPVPGLRRSARVRPYVLSAQAAQSAPAGKAVSR
ncbi:hypothetical protein ABH917_003348 [Thermobifida halotolerans]